MAAQTPAAAWIFGEDDFFAGLRKNVAPDEFPKFDERIEVDFCCPRCAYKWSGKAKPSAAEIAEDFEQQESSNDAT